MVMDIRTVATSPNCVMRAVALSGLTLSEAVPIILISGSTTSSGASVATSLAGAVSRARSS